jgi:iron complex transport system substrate-binding protein
MLCGFGVERTLAELSALQSPAALSTLRSAPVWIIDGNAYTSRSGPRFVDGAELLEGALKGRESRGMVRWGSDGG